MGDQNLNPAAQDFRPRSIMPTPQVNALYYFTDSPTRSLLLTNAYSSLSILRSQLEAYGDVRALYTDIMSYGRVIVHFYNINSAETAFRTIRSYYYQIQRYYNFTPTASLCAFYIFLNPDALRSLPPFLQHHNQGTIVVFNLDCDVSVHTLHQSFQSFGPIKEVRNSPTKRNVKFVEFFDVRDAGRALIEMNGKQIGGNNIVIQFSRPGRRVCAGEGNNNVFNAHFNGPNYYNYYRPQPQLHVAFNNNNYYYYAPRPLPILQRPPFLQSRPIISTIHSSANNLYQPNNDEDYSQYEIKEDNDDGGNVDSRTTLMIKNIPNRYSQNDILNILDKHCIKCNQQIGEGNDQPLSSYDFIYLPIDFCNDCNMGYGFVNMTSPQAALRLYKALHGKHWGPFGSRKICQITYAKYQGTEELKEKLKDSKLIEGLEKKIEYTPIMFNPARDGRQVTKPESLWMHPVSDD